MKRQSQRNRTKTILFGVTADRSLGLLKGFPEYIAECGWHVHVVSAPGPRSAALSTNPRVHTHTITMKRNPSLIKDFKALLSWIKLIRAIRPDVVSVGTPKAGLLGSFASWLLRVPDRVYVLRGLRLETTYGIQRRILAALEKLSFKFSTRALAVSQSLCRQAIDLGLVQEDKITVLGLGSSNGVDIQRFRPRSRNDVEIVKLRESLKLSSGRPTIGFVGRLNADKGLTMLSAALKQIDSCDLQVQLLLVGGEDDAFTTDDHTFGTHLDVIATGYVSDTSLFYSLMDVFCLPSRREGFPNVVLEASASGIPTVTTTATGAIDSVIDGKTGIIVDKNDPAALATALTSCIRDDALRAELGANARSWVVKHFERSAVWAKTGEFLESANHSHKNSFDAKQARTTGATNKEAVD